jgi:MoaA/NifB/PqqE/SkfB family radical SAM enzyme
VPESPDLQRMIEREQIANRSKHWVRLVTACNNRCLFCLDMDTPRNVYLAEEDVKAELLRGRRELDAWKVILSGGEASVHPLFPEFIRYAHEVGYGRVQTVTNGMFYGDRAFFERVMAAGLNEITFSLHGHTPELHDHLVQTPGAFKRLVKGLIRALRDGRPIVNVDVVINKQNVGYIDKIVELCASLGVREFDLLHVIPQSEAFRNADQMFYDVREHLPRLQKVFRLNRRGFHIWTNRFPVSYLEGLEDLIQDPHKMLDEVNGRRFQLRRYLDAGEPLDCRQPERCVHCFIQPFCNTADRVIAAQNARSWDVWARDTPAPGEPLLPGGGAQLPYGARMLGLRLPDAAALRALALPAGAGLYLELDDPAGLTAADLPAPSALVARTAAQLDAWVGGTQGDLTGAPGVEVEIRLNKATAGWMLAHRERLAEVLDRVRLRQPTHEHLQTALEEDVEDPRGFFESLALPIRAAGLPPCLTPGATLDEGLSRLEAVIFDPETGRPDTRELARFHVRERYRGKSVRCRDCRLSERCEGLHINAIRAIGLGRLKPLTTGGWADDADAQLRARWPAPEPVLETGRAPEPVAPSLPGFPGPGEVPVDPMSDAERHLRRSDFLNRSVEGNSSGNTAETNG